MRKELFRIALMALGASLASSGQAQDIMTLTHGVGPNDPVYPYTGFSVNEDVKDLSAVVMFTGEQVSRLAGGKIKTIHIGWSGIYQGCTPETTVFVRTSLNGENVASATGTLDSDWNVFDYDTPYEIKEGDDIVIGYTVDLPSGIFGPCTTVYGAAGAGEQYISRADEVDENGDPIWIDLAQMPGMEWPLMIYADVEVAGGEHSNLAVIENIIMPSIARMDEVGTGSIRVKNTGANAIESIEITYSSSEGAGSTYELDLGGAIQSNEAAWVAIPVFGMKGTDATCSIIKVNGADNGEEATAEFNTIFVDAETADLYERRPVLEYFASESDYLSAKYLDTIIEPGYEGYKDKLTKIYWHYDDPFQLGIADEKDEVLDMLIEIFNYDKSKVYVPNQSIDRDINLGLPISYLSGRENYLTGIIYPEPAQYMYEYAFQVPTFASVEVNASKEGDGEAKVNVKGKVAPGVLPAGEDLYLTVLVVEDGIWTDSQEFPDDGEGPSVREYIHNNLVRELLTYRWGDKIELDSEGNYSTDYTFEVSEDYNTDNVRVVAFVNRDFGNSQWERGILNSSECALTSTGVNSALQDMNVTVADGRITAGDANVEVFDLLGKRVANSNLKKGVYVVKVEGAPNGMKFVVK